MLNDILNVTNQELDSIDLSIYKDYAKKVLNYNEWFFEKSGKEHYRLLAYISSLYNNTNIIDIGTYKGFSALALSKNKNNKIHSYDISSEIEIEYLKNHTDLCNNIEFKIENILSEEKLILSSPFIMLDTAHDGVFENIFINFLIEINWNGLLLLDDIHEYPALTEMWNKVQFEKYDLTNKGHWSGTGLINIK
jgi:predicted O-methyltransferase YrrM